MSTYVYHIKAGMVLCFTVSGEPAHRTSNKELKRFHNYIKTQNLFTCHIIKLMCSFIFLLNKKGSISVFESHHSIKRIQISFTN